MSGTEEGVTEPQATFSACFGQPFLALHPMRYADMLAKKISEHNADAWLVNTGWIGASAASGGSRCPLKYTRAILNAIHDGSLKNAEYENFPVFNLAIPKTCAGVPDEILSPLKAWKGTQDSYKSSINSLAGKFIENFKKYQDGVTKEVIEAGPQI